FYQRNTRSNGNQIRSSAVSCRSDRSPEYLVLCPRMVHYAVMARFVKMLIAVLLVGGPITQRAASAADARFSAFVASLWPEAQQAGVSRPTFDNATRGLEPDYKLPDLVLPGKKPSAAPPQAEFV